MKQIIIFLTLLLNFFSTPSWSLGGLVQVKSQHSLEDTVKRFNAKATRAGMPIYAVISHDAEAKKVDKMLRPTRLILFGNPKVASAMMQCSQNTGIDLPLKALVWQDHKGDVYLTYNNPKYVEARHELKVCRLPIDKIAATIKKVVFDVAQKK